MTAVPITVQEFEVEEALALIREDYGRGMIDASCMEREIDFALRGLRDQSAYLSMFGHPQMERIAK